MMTTWGEALDRGAPLPEYPRPHLVRGDWRNLNGPWRYAITTVDGAAAESYQVPEANDPARVVPDPLGAPAAWDGEIVIPFSPEVPLSGVERTVAPHQALWYGREFALPRPLLHGERALLHFGAVDQLCRVAVNGVEVGSHVGGYLPFELDITEALVAPRTRDSAQTLTVSVRDFTDTSWHSRGKQKIDRGGVWYSPQSGIWQTVWVEIVPKTYIERVILTPHLDRGVLEVAVVSRFAKQGSTARVEIRDGARPIAQVKLPVSGSSAPGDGAEIPFPEGHTWSPSDPHLYQVSITLGRDRVESYFAWRSFGVGFDEGGTPCLLLNGQPHLPIGLLDQGYWPDGGYTAPSDEAFVFDIALAKDMGYDMLRKHIKVEPMRWYYHCDRLGMLVWQDLVNGGGRHLEQVVTWRVLIPFALSDRHARLLARQGSGGREQFEREVRQTIDVLRGIPSISLWVPFNEGWGQFDTARICRLVRELDPTRPVDHASGWFDQGAGDLHSVHIYFRSLWAVGRGATRRERRVLAITEYGGYSLPVPGHMYSSMEEVSGYRQYGDAREFFAGFARLHAREVEPAIRRGVRALVYTQLADVEDEANGLTTYDRKRVKVPGDLVRRVNRRLRAAWSREMRRTSKHEVG